MLECPLHTKEGSDEPHPYRPLNPPSNGGGLIGEALLASALYASAIDSAAVSPMPKFTHCVAQRESHHNPKARNPRSSAQGKYQFLDRSWRDGLAYMVRDRLIQFGMPKRQAMKIRVTLVRKEIAKWPEVMQDIGHAEVLERGGWFHWRHGDRCDRLAK